MDEQYEEFLKRLREMADVAIELEPHVAVVLYVLCGTILSKWKDNNDLYLELLSEYAKKVAIQAKTD